MLEMSGERAMTRGIMKAEILDAGTEKSLARAWLDRRDEKAMHRLINAHMRMAVSIARRFSKNGTSYEDLVQEASIGLLKAADKFDPNLDLRFSTYARWWVKASIQEHMIRDISMVRVGSTEKQKKIYFNLRKSISKIEQDAIRRGEAMSRDKIMEQAAKEMNVPMRDVQFMDARLSKSDSSLNAPLSDEEGSADWMDSLEDDAPPVDEVIGEAQGMTLFRARLEEVIGKLSDREVIILKERVLSEEPKTLQELSEDFGLSKERVRQIEVKILYKIKGHLKKRPEEIADFMPT